MRVVVDDGDNISPLMYPVKARSSSSRVRSVGRDRINTQCAHRRPASLCSILEVYESTGPLEA
jgi:hypothetical protein